MNQEIKVTNIDATQPLKVANTYTFMTEGAADYLQLINKPSINNVPLIGNKTSAELGIKQSYTADEITSVGTTNQFVTNGEKSMWSAKSDFSGSYMDLTNKPTIPSTLASLTDDAAHRLVTDTEKSTWNAKSDFSGSYNDLSNAPVIPTDVNDLTDTSGLLFSGDYVDLDNKPFIPATLADLSDDATHRVVTDTEKGTWNNKQDALGFTPENIANKGTALGYAALDGGGKIPMSNLPSTILHYIGTWNAEENLPELVSPNEGKAGHVYTISVPGTRFGIEWKLGDWLIYNAAGIPEKSDNSDDVLGVNGKTGIVVLDTDDISESSGKQYVSPEEKTTWNAKLDKIEGSTRVYSNDGTGAPGSLSYQLAATQFTIAYRNTGGRLAVGTPTDAADATTKAYVDNAITTAITSALGGSY